MTTGGVLLQLVTDLSRARRQTNAWISIALSALEALAEARRELSMINGTLARRYAAADAERWRSVDAAYDGHRSAPQKAA